MSQTLTLFPIGNAETCLLELSNGRKILFDYADMYDGTDSDNRYDINRDLSSIGEFDVVMFTHAHEDHTKKASEFFFFDHAKKYQSNDRAKINELWISAAFLLDTELENASDAKIIRAEAQYRLKEGYGIKVFAEPNSLNKWLEEHSISHEDVSQFIVHAGTNLNLPYFLSDELEVFVHAPFSKDSEEVQDRNDPSIVLQVRLINEDRKTNLLITGDVTYQVLDKVVDISKDNGNEEFLSWDIYDIPHHCSYTGLNEKTEDDIIIPTENIKWLLKQSAPNSYMIASCDSVTEDTSPPHLCAKRGYEKYSAEDVSLLITMDHIPYGSEKPSPIRFEIDSMGITLKKEASQDVFLKRSAPRAGAV